MDRGKQKPERRKSPRASASIVVRYHTADEYLDYDLSQTRNISQGGLLMTTNRMFSPGISVAMTVFFPFMDNAAEVLGDVVESREIMEDQIYETHVHFHGLEEKMSEQLAGFVDHLAA